MGRFQVLRTLGKGGMGTVVEAYDASLERRVALKLLLPGMASRHAERLRREALALARLSHPNVVQVYEVGEAEGRTFIAMELVEGQTLGQWQRSGRVTWRECVEAYVQAGRGLVAAHAQGLVHRDFKPGNCIIDDEGRVRVLDFGLARDRQIPSLVRSTLDSISVSSSGSSLRTPLTQTGAVLGTLAYMPREQLMGKEVDVRSDQFSFCVSLYEGLYGHRPFNYDTVGKLAIALERGDVRPAPRHSKVPARLRRALLRGLSSKPRDRWPSMQALLTELEQIARPRRVVWATAAFGVGAAILGAGLWQQARAEVPCSDDVEPLSGAWDDSWRERVQRAMSSTGVSFAEQTWERVSTRLDAYAQAWVDSRADACEATHVRHEQSADAMDLRMACLARSRVALRQTVEVLASADVDVVEHAVQLVGGLPSLERCNDVEGLRDAVAPPEDPEIAREVEGLRERLGRVRTLERLGKYDEAWEELETLAPQSASLGYGPLVAEVALHRGLVQDWRGHHQDAVPVLEEAYVLAVEHGHEPVALEATRGLVRVNGSRDAKHEAAMQWGLTALALARRADEGEVALSTTQVGSALRIAGELDEAIEHFRRALAIRESLGETDDPELAHLLSELGQALTQKGELDEADEVLERALATQQRVLGPEHPTVALTWSAMGNLAYDRGELDRAQELQERALALTERALGAEHVATAGILVNLSAVMFRRETDASLEQAQAYLERALSIQEEALGQEHKDVTQTMGNLATVMLRRGEQQRALELFEKVLVIEERVLGPDHFSVGILLSNLGNVQQQLGRPREAEEHLLRSVAILEEVLGAEHQHVAKGLISLCIVSVDLGELEAAERYALRALAIFEKTLPPEHPARAGTLGELGLVYEAQGRLEESLEKLQQALEIDEQAFGPQSDAVVKDLVRLARVQLARGRIETAHELAARAVELGEQESISGVWLARARFQLARTLWPTPSERGGARALVEQAIETFEGNEAYRRFLERARAWQAEHGAR